MLVVYFPTVSTSRPFLELCYFSILLLSLVKCQKWSWLIFLPICIWWIIAPPNLDKLLLCNPLPMKPKPLEYWKPPLPTKKVVNSPPTSIRCFLIKCSSVSNLNRKFSSVFSNSMTLSHALSMESYSSGKLHVNFVITTLSLKQSSPKFFNWLMTVLISPMDVAKSSLSCNRRL